MFNLYPYLNVNDLNLDYLLLKIKELTRIVDNFVSLNTVKYANPIQWNITKQYEQNTVVVDANDGTAYLSVKPVPTGVAISNTDYWTPIFTLNLLSANQNLTFRDDGSNVLATFTSAVDDWLIWNSKLYIVTRAININEAYVEGYNISRYTVELFIKDYVNALNLLIGDLTTLTTSDKTNLVNAINELVGKVSNNTTHIGDLSTLTTSATSDLVSAINEVNGEVSNLIIYNVMDYGAIGDGVNDDTNAIQSCINAAPSGAIIYAPANKTYLLNSDGVNINKRATYIFGGTYLLDSANGAAFYIDKNVEKNAAGIKVYIEDMRPTDTYSIFGQPAPSSMDRSGNCGIRIRRTTRSAINIGRVMGFTYAGVFAECDNLAGDTVGPANNEIVLHNTISVETIAHCGAGFYARSESSERNCFQANEVHLNWLFGCYQDVRLDDNNADYFVSTSNLFIITAIDNSHVGDGGAGIMCASYYNKFIVAYMGCAAVFNTYSGFNQLDVANTFATDVSFTDSGLCNRISTSMPGKVDGSTHLPTTTYPRNLTPTHNIEYTNDSGVPIDIYFRCYNTDGTNAGAVDAYIGNHSGTLVHPIKEYIEPAANSSSNARTIVLHVPTNWTFRFNYSNVTVSSCYWIQN